MPTDPIMRRARPRSAPRLRLWKGLDPGETPVFLGYAQIERMIAALLDRAAAWQPEVVAGVARGGLVPATMAATLLARPLAVIAHERASGAVRWQGPPPAARRVLLVDDGCSTGGTLSSVREALQREGRTVLTLTVVHDPDRTGLVPDLSHPMRALWRFPWERGETTPEGRALRAMGGGPDRRAEAPVAAVDLDGVFLPDLAALLAGAADQALPPFFRPDRGLLITSRPEGDCWRIRAALRRRGVSSPLECCAGGAARDRRGLATRKAEAALRYGCTHFVESDAREAILIAAAAPPLIVAWWRPEDARAFIVGAAEGVPRGLPADRAR